MKTVDIAQDFTRFPSGRKKENGRTSGEEFRARFLEPALRAGDQVSVRLDGTIGYGSSFLEEAFGGTVRSLDLSADAILNRLTLVSKDSGLIEEIKDYIRAAAAANKR